MKPNSFTAAPRTAQLIWRIVKVEILMASDRESRGSTLLKLRACLAQWTGGLARNLTRASGK